MPTILPLALDQVFDVGLALSLEFADGGSRVHLLSRVENVAGDRLWVAMPMRAGMFIPLPVSTPVSVQIKREDALYVLPARVQGCRLQPCPMLELIPTGEIDRQQRRRHVRLQIVLVPALAALVADDGTETRLPATVVNVSGGGALVRTRQTIEVGQRLRLAIELPPPGGPIDCLSEILRVTVQRAERGYYYEASTHFLDLADRERDRITKFIFHFQSRMARREQGDLV